MRTLQISGVHGKSIYNAVKYYIKTLKIIIETPVISKEGTHLIKQVDLGSLVSKFLNILFIKSHNLNFVARPGN